MMVGCKGVLSEFVDFPWGLDLIVLFQAGRILMVSIDDG